MAKHHGHLTSEEKKEIRIGRKKLRKDLRIIGITKRREFEEIAQYLGLVYGDDWPGFLLWWWRFGDWFLGWAKWVYALVALGILGIVFLFSVMANQKGNFLVTMSPTMAQSGLLLSDDEAFTEPKVTLKSDVLKEVNAFSFMDLPDNLDTDFEGSHNLPNVVCYTFWVTNDGYEAMDVNWYLLFNRSTKNVDQATWLMLYEDGKMSLHSRASQLDGETAEKLEGASEAYLQEQCAEPNKQYKKIGGQIDIVSFPYVENRIVAEGQYLKLRPKETHKFTTVIWVDGDDPDCTGDLIGGHAGFSMKFVGADETDEVYTKYGGRMETPDDLKGKGVSGALNGILDGLRNRGCFGKKPK